MVPVAGHKTDKNYDQDDDGRSTAFTRGQDGFLFKGLTAAKS